MDDIEQRIQVEKLQDGPTGTDGTGSSDRDNLLGSKGHIQGNDKSEGEGVGKVSNSNGKKDGVEAKRVQVMPKQMPLVSCLTATHGRYRVLQEAVTCFMEQDYANRELIILNAHPVPLVCDFPGVYVLNEPQHLTLGDCRNRLLQAARGELIRTWDDDDLYLPWAISQGVNYLGDNLSRKAWKPYKSWSWRKDKKTVELHGNRYEASWTVRKEAIVEVGGYLPNSGGNEHKPLYDKLKVASSEVTPHRCSYVYTWGTGLCHISGSLGGDTIENRTKRWKELNNDHGDGKPLELVDLSSYWKMLRTKADELVSHPNETE